MSWNVKLREIIWTDISIVGFSNVNLIGQPTALVYPSNKKAYTGQFKTPEIDTKTFNAAIFGSCINSLRQSGNTQKAQMSLIYFDAPPEKVSWRKRAWLPFDYSISRRASKREDKYNIYKIPRFAFNALPRSLWVESRASVSWLLLRLRVGIFKSGLFCEPLETVRALCVCRMESSAF